MRSTSILTFTIGGLALVACRGSDSNVVDGNGGDGTGASVRIQDVQNDAMAPGTAVTLTGVVVTAIDSFGGKVGDFWVEEPEGGPFSGVHVFKAPTSSVAALAVGDIVDISGAVKSEFALSGSNADSSGRTVTELEPVSGGTMVVTKTGTGTVPTPAVVDALAIGKMYDPTMSTVGGGAAFSAAWEQWEGVLVTLSNVTALGAPKAFGMTMPTPADNYSFGITGVAKVEASLAAFPTSGVTSGACLATVTGVVDYFYDYLVLPRDTTEVTSGGTSCPAREQANGTDGSLCTDSMDNDGNGFSDCNDLGCEVGANAWLGANGTACTATTCGCSVGTTAGSGVNAVDTGYATMTGPVLLHDVYVTAIGPKGYWVADALQATTNGGVFVFTGAAPDATIVIGKKLATLQGLAGPFGTTGQTVIEISSPTNSAPVTGGSPSAITTATAAQVSSLANGGPYAGSLVTLTHLKVTTTPAQDAHNQVTLVDNNGTTLTMDDGAFANFGGTSMAPTLPAMGTCYSTMTGVMDVQTTDQLRTINPRSAGDMTVGTGCN